MNSNIKLIMYTVNIPIESHARNSGFLSARYVNPIIAMLVIAIAAIAETK